MRKYFTSALTAFLFLSWVAHPQDSRVYPAFGGPVTRRTGNADAQMEPVLAALERYGWKRASEKLSTATMAKTVAGLEEQFGKQPGPVWEIVAPPGRMPLPVPLLLTQRYRLDGGVDANFFVDVLASDPQSQGDLFAYGLLSQFWFAKDPQTVLSRMAHAEQPSPGVRSVDILRLLAVTSWEVYHSPSRSLPAEDWRLLRNSPNPCRVFIALGSWHRAVLSPEERLQACRDSLFGACSFLEARTLDLMREPGCHSEAMQALVREYLASSPVPNDHTLPGPDGPWEESRQYTLATAILALPPSTEEEVKASTVAATPPPDDEDKNTSTPASRPERMPGLPGGSILAKTKSVQYMQFGFALLVVLLALWYLRKCRAER